MAADCVREAAAPPATTVARRSAASNQLRVAPCHAAQRSIVLRIVWICAFMAISCHA